MPLMDPGMPAKVLRRFESVNKELLLLFSLFAIAGLLNVLAIYDAYAGPMIVSPPDSKRDAKAKASEVHDADLKEKATDPKATDRDPKVQEKRNFDRAKSGAAKGDVSPTRPKG